MNKSIEWQVDTGKSPNFKTYNQASAIETVWYWHEGKDTDHWNKIDRPEIICTVTAN